MIEANRLQSKIGCAQILNEIDLRIDWGGLYTFLGANGSGKTSLLRLMSLIDPFSGGDIRIEGNSVRGWNSRQKTAFRRRIGFVFQHPLLLRATVAENIEWPLRIRRRPCNRRNIELVLERFGLTIKSGEAAQVLSGGEQQRLQLARVWALDPDILYLDEPTANLDPVSSDQVETAIREMAATGKTILLSTHHLLQARRLGGKIHFLQSGRLLQEGSMEQILKTPSCLEIANYSLSGNLLRGDLTKKGGIHRFTAGGISMEVTTSLPPGPVHGYLPYEDIIISRTEFVSSARNALRGTVIAVDDLGIYLLVRIGFENFSLTASITRQSIERLGITIGETVMVSFKASALHILSGN